MYICDGAFLSGVDGFVPGPLIIVEMTGMMQQLKYTMAATFQKKVHRKAAGVVK